jgi:hypothetical protein
VPETEALTQVRSTPLADPSSSSAASGILTVNDHAAAAAAATPQLAT